MRVTEQSVRKFDMQDYLNTAENQAGYLEAVASGGSPALIAAAVGDIARARGITRFSHESGISRETIYKMFREGGNPTLLTLSRALDAIGFHISVRAKDSGRKDRRDLAEDAAGEM